MHKCDGGVVPTHNTIIRAASSQQGEDTTIPEASPRFLFVRISYFYLSFLLLSLFCALSLTLFFLLLDLFLWRAARHMPRDKTTSQVSVAVTTEPTVREPCVPRLMPTAPEDIHALAEQFSVQGLRVMPDTDLLWCTLCTTVAMRKLSVAPLKAPFEPSQETLLGGSQPVPDTTTAGPGEDAIVSSLSIVGRTTREIMAHCATHAHLVSYESIQERDLAQWCRVNLDGRNVLLDHHCLYPAAMYGPGRVIMDRTLAGGMLLAADVCGGVKLWARHRYELVELVLPAAHNGATCVLEPGEHLHTAGATSSVAVGDVVVPVPHAETRLFHPLSGRPEHMQDDAEIGSGGCSGTRWRTTRRGKRKVDESGTQPEQDVAEIPSCDLRTAVLPTFAKEERGPHGGVRSHQASAPALLQHVNRTIKGEATERARRRRRLELNNMKDEGTAYEEL